MSETWVRGFLSRLDQMSPDDIVPDFAEDACFRIGNGAIAVGLQSIRHAIEGRFGRLRSTRREARVISCYPGTVMIEADVYYVDDQGNNGSLVEATILHFEGDRIVDYRVFY